MAEQLSELPHKSRKPSVLVVEDNADQWFIIRSALLERFPEVEPIWVSDSHQAVMHLETCEPDARQLPKLILLDLYLPQREQGYSLLQIIKVHHLYREIPVIILSQSNDLHDISESYTLRTNSYIVKPNSYENWLNCIASFRNYWWNAVTLPKFT